MRRIDTGGQAASGTLGARGATRDRSFWADWGRSLTAAAAAAAVVYFAISVAMDHRADRLQKRLALLESQLTEMQSTQRQTEQSINLQQQRGASLQLVALEGTPDAPGAKALVFWDRPRGIWHMYAFGLNPPGNAKEYELWYIVGDQKIPAGSFSVTPNGEALLTTKLPPNLGNVTLAAITDEPIGQPHLQPTGKIRLAGPIVQ
jgi:anti-sigma-K factor RskA